MCDYQPRELTRRVRPLAQGAFRRGGRAHFLDFGALMIQPDAVRARLSLVENAQIFTNMDSAAARL